MSIHNLVVSRLSSTIGAIVYLVFALGCGNCFGADDYARGKALYDKTCVACHGAEGNSLVPQWPKLAGQHQTYTIKQIQAFQQGEKGPRYNAQMIPMIANLSVEDVHALAAYLASQPIKLGAADPNLVARGEAIYRGGDLSKGITACMACHGPTGLGNESAGFPVLSGQHPEYVVVQLKAYQSGTRKTDSNGIMRDISKRMDEQDMLAVASYVSGLH